MNGMQQVTDWNLLDIIPITADINANIADPVAI
jgi:hypothetical protein